MSNDVVVEPTGAAYRPPVDQLLRFGAPDAVGAPGDYGALGMGREHIPELIRMATDKALNGGLVSVLIDLGAVEAAPVMEKAYTAGRGDEMHCGDGEDIQIELGLKGERETERKPNKWTERSLSLREREEIQEMLREVK